ncbi:MAG: ferrous iron transport protein A [Candidatus Lokiarchaeota archaeon]|nr:ferrous iron transport protein A [Candidatus Lokiarchaeota archaeon]MBD3341149.1 ferrous iron transport protein A [Candidatus Lokiarchaeota archaeon]
MIDSKESNTLRNNNNQKGTALIKCLTKCEKGEEMTVLSVNVGFRQKQRLANLGLVPGAKIKKTKAAPFKGPLEIYVKGSKMVIGRGLARKIFVECGDACAF